MTPHVLSPTRRLSFARLVGLTAGEAASLAAAAALMKASVAAVGEGRMDVMVLAALFAIGLVAAALQWARAVAAEDFGMDFANELRVSLAKHAMVIAAVGRKRRLGGLSSRMAGDVLALKNWAAEGVSAAGAAVASAIGGVVAMGLAIGPHGAWIGAGLVGLQLALIVLIWPRLEQAWAQVRRDRGRVAALAGDMALAGAAIVKYDAVGRETRRLRTRNQHLRRASVGHRRWAAALLAASSLISLLALAAAVLLLEFNLGGPSGIDTWAAYLFGAGLLGSACAGIAGAVDAFIGFRVADKRMRALEAQARGGEAPPLALTEAGKAFVHVDLSDEAPRPLSRGEVVLVRFKSISEALERVRAAGDQSSGTMIKGSPLAALRPRDAARWCALVCPEIGLLRTSLRRNLTVRRRTVHDGELRAALLLVGLDPDVWSLDRLVDPEIADPDLWTQARLRLARAIVHKPRIILIAEPTLAQDPFTPALLQRLSEATRAAIVCAYGGEETAGLAIWPAAA